jgi:16S rRNA processing protein RimM
MGVKYLTVGRIIRPHGLKGQVEIAPLTDAPERFKAGSKFKLAPPTGDRADIKLRDVAQKKNRLIAGIEGSDSREAVEELLGRELMIPESEGEKPDDSYWQHDIIGCDVRTTDGRDLGKVREILRTGPNDLYVVGDEKQYYVPAVKQVVKSIDIEGRLIVIEPIPGLLEL